MIKPKIILFLEAVPRIFCTSSCIRFLFTLGDNLEFEINWTRTVCQCSLQNWWKSTRHFQSISKELVLQNWIINCILFLHWISIFFGGGGLMWFQLHFESVFVIFLVQYLSFITHISSQWWSFSQTCSKARKSFKQRKKILPFL